MPAQPSKQPPQGPLNVAELVAHQSNSVVSHQILKKPHGTVTIFAFDQAEGLSEHTAPFDALAHVIEGKAEITIAGTTHQLTTGQMIIMPAGKPHAVHATQSFKMILTMIKS